MTKKHEYIGVIEGKKVWGLLHDPVHPNPNLCGMVKRLFLLHIDTTSKKIVATYGPFENDIDLNDHAAFLGIKVKTNV
jgi:hypothetical protein